MVPAAARRDVLDGELRTALRFGLPRLPHGLAQQALEAGNKLLLRQLRLARRSSASTRTASTLGTGVAVLHDGVRDGVGAVLLRDREAARRAATSSRKMTTYGVAVLVLLVAGTTAVARDVILVMLTPEYLGALPVVPLIAIGIAFQGVYLLTSIGLNLTSRTEFYPVSTIAAALVGLASRAAC